MRDGSSLPPRLVFLSPEPRKLEGLANITPSSLAKRPSADYGYSGHARPAERIIKITSNPLGSRVRQAEGA
jgi:hypothetical protein